MAVNTIIAGVSSGAQYAAEFNKVASALNTCGQYSHNATVALTTTPTAIPFGVNDTQFGNINHSISTNTTRFNVTFDGDYIFTMAPQISHITTGNGDCVFWLRKNGTTPVGNSRADYKMGGIIGTDVLIITTVIQLVANDYIEVMSVASANSEHEITFRSGSGSGATALPNSPSIMLTVTQLPL